jgi:uncharacterized membrane protein
VTPENHMLVVEESDERVTIFACMNCERRVLIDRISRDYVVLEQGDVWALHSGVSGPFSLAVQAQQQQHD